ncbi:uncharacterized protein LOC143301053 [Babylonia areolata]|uniref:uncharacterized protein LOC143301053 n=1 Tax=Babylonia areolata TaxID=304850 RepID=UPI003FD590A2
MVKGQRLWDGDRSDEDRSQIMGCRRVTGYGIVTGHGMVTGHRSWDGDRSQVMEWLRVTGHGMVTGHRSWDGDGSNDVTCSSLLGVCSDVTCSSLLGGCRDVTCSSLLGFEAPVLAWGCVLRKGILRCSKLHPEDAALQSSFDDTDNHDTSSLLTPPIHHRTLATTTAAITTNRDNQGAFQPAMSDTSSSPVLPRALEKDILDKLLDQQQVRALASRLATTPPGQLGPGPAVGAVLRSVHIMGLSPAFAAVLRHMYRVKVKVMSRGQHAQSVPEAARRVRREADEDVEAEILNAHKDEDGVVTLDFFLKTKEGEVVAMETAFQTLQSLSAEEMSALLDLPVISGIEAVTRAATAGIMFTKDVTPSMTSPMPSQTVLSQTALDRSKRAVDSDTGVKTAVTSVSSSSSSPSFTSSSSSAFHTMPEQSDVGHLTVVPSSSDVPESGTLMTSDSMSSKSLLSGASSPSESAKSSFLSSSSPEISQSLSHQIESFSERTESLFQSQPFPERTRLASESFSETVQLSLQPQSFSESTGLMSSPQSFSESVPASLPFSETTQSSLQPQSFSESTSLMPSPQSFSESAPSSQPLSETTLASFPSQIPSSSAGSEERELSSLSPSYSEHVTEASQLFSTPSLYPSSLLSKDSPLVSSVATHTISSVDSTLSDILMTSSESVYMSSSWFSSLSPSFSDSVHTMPSSVRTRSDVSTAGTSVESYMVSQGDQTVSSIQVISSPVGTRHSTSVGLDQTSSVLDRNSFSLDSIPQSHRPSSDLPVPSSRWPVVSPSADELSSLPPLPSASLLSTPSIPDVSSVVVSSAFSGPIKSSPVSSLDQSTVYQSVSFSDVQPSVSMFSSVSRSSSAMSRNDVSPASSIASVLSSPLTSQFSSEYIPQGTASTLTSISVTGYMTSVEATSAGVPLSDVISPSLLSASGSLHVSSPLPSTDLGLWVTSSELDFSSAFSIAATPLLSSPFSVTSMTLFSSDFSTTSAPVFSSGFSITSPPVLSSDFSIISTPVFSNAFSIISTLVFSNGFSIASTPVFSNGLSIASTPAESVFSTQSTSVLTSQATAGSVSLTLSISSASPAIDSRLQSSVTAHHSAFHTPLWPSTLSSDFSDLSFASSLDSGIVPSSQHPSAFVTVATSLVSSGYLETPLLTRSSETGTSLASSIYTQELSSAVSSYQRQSADSSALFSPVSQTPPSLTSGSFASPVQPGLPSSFLTESVQFAVSVLSSLSSFSGPVQSFVTESSEPISFTHSLPAIISTMSSLPESAHASVSDLPLMSSFSESQLSLVQESSVVVSVSETVQSTSGGFSVILSSAGSVHFTVSESTLLASLSASQSSLISSETAGLSTSYMSQSRFLSLSSLGAPVSSHVIVSPSFSQGVTSTLSPHVNVSPSSHIISTPLFSQGVTSTLSSNPIVSPSLPQGVTSTLSSNPIVSPSLPQGVTSTLSSNPIVSPSLPQGVTSTLSSNSIVSPSLPQGVTSTLSSNAIVSPSLPQGVTSTLSSNAIVSPSLPQGVTSTMSSHDNVTPSSHVIVTPSSHVTETPSSHVILTPSLSQGLTSTLSSHVILTPSSHVISTPSLSQGVTSTLSSHVTLTPSSHVIPTPSLSQGVNSTLSPHVIETPSSHVILTPSLSQGVNSTLSPHVIETPSSHVILTPSLSQGVTSTLSSHVMETPSSHVIVSPSLSRGVTSTLSDSSATVSLGIVPTPTSSASRTASQSSDVTRPPTPEPSSFLRLRIRVPPGTDVNSPAFLQRMREALRRLYLAALRARRTRSRRKRQAEQVDAQIVGAESSGEGEATVDFRMVWDGEHVPTDTALDTLNLLTPQEMSDILDFPVVGNHGDRSEVVSLTKQVAVSNTVTALPSLTSHLAAITTDTIFITTTRSSSATTPSHSTHLNPSEDFTVPLLTSSGTPVSALTSFSASMDISIGSVSSGPDSGSGSLVLSSSLVGASPSASQPPSSRPDASPSISGSLSTKTGTFPSISGSATTASASESTQSGALLTSSTVTSSGMLLLTSYVAVSSELLLTGSTRFSSEMIFASSPVISSGVSVTSSAVISSDMLMTNSAIVSSDMLLTGSAGVSSAIFLTSSFVISSEMLSTGSTLLSSEMLPTGSASGHSLSVLTTPTSMTSASTFLTPGFVVSSTMTSSLSSASAPWSPLSSAATSFPAISTDQRPSSALPSVTDTALSSQVESSVTESETVSFSSVPSKSDSFLVSFSSVQASSEEMSRSLDTPFPSLSPTPSFQTMTSLPSRLTSMHSETPLVTTPVSEPTVSPPVTSAFSSAEIGTLSPSETVTPVSSTSGDFLSTQISHMLSSALSTATESGVINVSSLTTFTVSQMSSTSLFPTFVTSPSAVSSQDRSSEVVTSMLEVTSSTWLSPSFTSTTTSIPESLSTSSSTPELSSSTSSSYLSSSSMMTSVPESSTSTSSPELSSASTSTPEVSPSTTSTPEGSSSTTSTTEGSSSTTSSTEGSSSTTSTPEVSPSSTPSLPSTSSTPISTPATSPTSLAPTWTISPSPTETAVPPSSSAGPRPEDVREALLRVDLALRPDQDEQGPDFRNSFEQGMVTAYQRALQIRRRKRHALPDDVIASGRLSKRDAARQAGLQTEAEVTDVIRNSSDPGLTNVTFYMSEDGKPIAASEAAATLNKLTPNALSALLAYPVVSHVRPLHSQPPLEAPFDEDVGLLFVVAVVLPCVLLLLLLFILLSFLVRSCRHHGKAAPFSSDVVGTKYQRGDTLDDYNLHVDVERGEIVDRTPGHTPQPDSRSPCKTPPPSLESEDEENTLNGKRLMMDQWLKEEHHLGSDHDSDSVAKSDTYLYSRRKEEEKQKKKKGRQGAVPCQSYKNEYLQVLRMPETGLTQEELTGDATGKPSDSFALQERSFEEDGPRSPSPRRGTPPQAKPRSLMGKLRSSIRKRKRSATPDYNTQSTVVSAVGDSSHNLTDRSGSSETSAEPEAESRADHTDASDEFTFAMMPKAQSARPSVESLPTTPDTDTDAQPVEKSGHITNRDNRQRAEGGPEPRPRKLQGVPKGSMSSPDSSEEGPDLTDRKSRRHQHAKPPRSPSTDKDDDSTLPADSEARFPGPRTTQCLEDLVPILRTIQTQTSLASSSDDSRGGDVRVKSVAVGPTGVNRKTQTPADRVKKKRDQDTRKPVTSKSVAVQRPRRQPLFSSMSGSDTQGSTASMEEEQLEEQEEEEEEFPPERIEPFVKMSQLATTPTEKDATIPVKFRRNLFEDGPQLPDTTEDTDMSVERQPQVFYKPAHHMRAQPRAAYSVMDPEQRRQAEMVDTALTRQQLLLRQQQEAMAFTHRQHLDQQAQHLVNRSLAMGTTSTTPAPHHLQQQEPFQHHQPQPPQPQADRQVLTALLNQACVLAPQRPAPSNPQSLLSSSASHPWTPTPPVLNPQGYFNNPITVLGSPAVGLGAPAPGGPGFVAMNQEELMQAVRKELKRMQQE